MDLQPDITETLTSACPMAAAEDEGLRFDEELVLQMPRRMVLQYGSDAAGKPELCMYYGDRQVTFDESDLFVFAETLSRQSRFRAGAATQWGDGYDWSRIRECLEALIGGGILERTSELVEEPPLNVSRQQPSPLAPALTNTPRSWQDCAAITGELTGRSVELGYLELVIPVFRVAHIARDADGRQVGEANVFPRALRLDAPTEWLTCTYSGTRHMVERPMNVTALKSMRAHWPQMMAALHVIRGRYLERFPNIQGPLTVGQIERLATLVLAVPTYQLMRPETPVANGSLHPALSSLFRVTDGLRMAMHQMLFVPIGEPTLSPHERVSVEHILDYAERNYSFHSETGVCAGPKHFVREFLSVLVDGKIPEGAGNFDFSPDVASALYDIDAAFDYGLEGLRAHAALFTFWPAMARAYDRLTEIAGAAVADGAGCFEAVLERLRQLKATAERSTYLASEAWRMDREAVYAEMFDASGVGLGDPPQAASLPQRFASARTTIQPELVAAITGTISRAIPGSNLFLVPCSELAACIAAFAHDTQAILRVAVTCQMRINRRLVRAEPVRTFNAQDMTVHVRLQGSTPRRLPFLFDEIAGIFGIRLEVDTQTIQLAAGEATARPHN